MCLLFGKKNNFSKSNTISETMLTPFIVFTTSLSNLESYVGIGIGMSMNTICSNMYGYVYEK